MGFRFPGPTGAPSRPPEMIDVGTTQPVEHHAPGITDALKAAGRASPLLLLGPMGIGAAGVAVVGQLYYAKNLDALTEVRNRATALAPAAIADATGFSDLGKLLDSLLHGLLAAMIALAASTALGGAIGGVIGFFFGGAGAAPGAVAGAKVGFEVGLALLTWLGVGFLAASIIGGLGELISLELSAVRRGWAAGDLNGPRRNAEIEAAAKELAKAAGVLMRLVLEGILAYLMRGAPMATTRTAAGTVNQVRTTGSGAVAAETVADLVAQLRKSRLGKGFADWVELNWQKLLDNPKLRRYAPEVKAPTATGVAGPSATPSQARNEVGQRRASNEQSTRERDLTVLGPDGMPIGAVKGEAPLGLQRTALKKDGWPDLPAREAPNFSSAEPVTLPPGSKIYRIVDDSSNPAGGYWSDKLPSGRAEWRADYAVKADWNTNGKYVEYTVPEGPGLNVWKGPSAGQNLKGYDAHLPGGEPQIWMPPGTVSPGPAMPTGW